MAALTLRSLGSGLAAALITLLYGGAVAEPSAPLKSVSRETLLGLEPLQIGQAFLRRGERVGILLRAEDFDTSYELPPGMAAGENARTAAGLEAFSASHPKYRLGRTLTGTLRLLPKTPVKCAPYLRGAVGGMSMDAPIMDVLAAIVRQRNPEVADGPASVMGSASESAMRPFVQVVRYSFQGGTVEDALDALILAAPGTRWLVVEQPPSPSLDAYESFCEAKIFSEVTVVTGFTF